MGEWKKTSKAGEREGGEGREEEQERKGTVVQIDETVGEKHLFIYFTFYSADFNLFCFILFFQITVQILSTPRFLIN